MKLIRTKITYNIAYTVRWDDRMILIRKLHAINLEMKTFGHIIIIFLFSTKLYGQHMFLAVDPSVEINTGYRLTQNSFYNQINSFNDFNSSRPLFTFGLGIGDHYALGARHAFRKVLFNQILPQNIVLNKSRSFEKEVYFTLQTYYLYLNV